MCNNKRLDLKRASLALKFFSSAFTYFLVQLDHRYIEKAIAERVRIFVQNR